MKLIAGLRKHGFRKWYERELLQSHGHMVLAFLCMIGVMAALEAAFHFRGLVDQLIDGMAVLICGAVGIWALRRYLYLLSHAEAVAHQADCPGCGTYARFTLVQEKGDDTAGVRCRQCAHEWTIEA